MKLKESRFGGYEVEAADGDGAVRVSDFRLGADSTCLIVRGIGGEPLLSDEQASALSRCLLRALVDRTTGDAQVAYAKAFELAELAAGQ